jgi:hypothetical protein
VLTEAGARCESRRRVQAPLFLAWMFFGPLQLVAVIWLIVRLKRASLPRIEV